MVYIYSILFIIFILSLSLPIKSFKLQKLNSIFNQMWHDLSTRHAIKQHQKSTKSQMITIFPKQISFEEVQSHSCYQIPLYIRNEGQQNLKIRIIQPITKNFKIKIDENYTKTLAPGLTIKLNIIFVCQRIGEQLYFEDNISVISETSKQTISIKAFPPREKFVIPKIWNLGRMLVNKQNVGLIPVRNEGTRGGVVYCQIPLAQIAQVNTLQLRMEPGESKNVELIIKSKKLGVFEESLVFSNGLKCVAKGVIVEESVQIIDENGQRFNILDLGPIFIGEKIEKSFMVLNNTNNQVQSIFKTFNRNIELNDLKIDSTRCNFVIKSPPQQYAKQLKSSYTSTLYQKCTLPKFQQFSNLLIIQRYPDEKQCRLFQTHANGNNYNAINEQPVIQSLIIKHSNNNNYVKIPIKFISVFPRIRISHQVIQFGEIKERMDYTKELIIYNEGERDVSILSENIEGLKVELSSILKSHSSQTVKMILRMVKSGQYAETIKINIFDGLFLEVKVFAHCRATSIRAKKLVNMNSARELRTGVSPLYRTLASPSNLQLTNSSSMMNKTTDLLSQLRSNRLNKLFKQHIQSEKQPSLKEPNLSLRFQNLDNHMKSTKILRKPKIQTIRPTKKQITTIGHELSKQQLQKIIIESNEIAFGTIFISAQLTRQVRVLNNNNIAILFQWDFAHNECLENSSSDLVKIEANSQKIFKICYKPNSLGTVLIPLQYIINRSHIFQITLTAFVTLINVQISTKTLDYNFSSLENAFEKVKTVQIQNKSNESVICLMKFQDNKHFYTNKQQIKLGPLTKQVIQVIYRPEDGQQSGLQRLDIDKLTIRVMGGAENTVKCIGQVNDAKVTIKQSQINHPLQLVSSLVSGKINLKNHSKIQTIVKIQYSNDLIGVLSFQKQMFLLGSEEKRQIGYTITCNQAKNINSFLMIRVRGSKTLKIPVQINMVFPQIAVSRKIIDFGNIPIMGNNYQETVTVTNLFKSQLRLQYSKKFDNEDYIIEIKELYRPKSQLSLMDSDLKIKKKQSNFRQQNKKIINNKIFKLLPNSETTYQIKFIPKKIQFFDIPIPLKLCGTSSNLLEPIGVRLVCTAIEPVVYLHPHHICFDTRIIGQGKSNNSRSFQIKNPHQFGIAWYIETQQIEKCQYFYLSEDRGHLNAKQTVHIDVMFKPQQQGHFFQKMNVVLKQKKISHISLQLEGNAILPSIKFNCNQLLMPIVPLGIQSKSIIILQNHGYDAITISKWKTSSHFQSVDVCVNFIQGKLLSLAKKDLKVEICIISSLPVSITTFLEFYDEFGNKYEVPVSFTCDNSIMTTYSYLQQKNNVIMLDKKENCVKISGKSLGFYQKSASLSAGQIAGCQFIKNWLNYEINLSIKSYPKCLIDSEGELLFRMINRISGLDLVKRYENGSQILSYSLYGYYCECIKTLKIQGAFLNQIRPEYLLSYKNYKAYLNSKNRIVQQQSNFQIISNGAWVALFYQLCKLFIMPNINDKIINKFVNISQSISSTIYSTQELLVFKFLNSFNNNEPFYDLGDQIKFFEIFQKSFEKTLGLNLSEEVKSIQITSLFITPSLFMILISKFLHEKLSQFGLCQFLNETDLFSLSSKELMITMASFITMLYHYVNSSSICFQATIGDKITKIIDIQNPLNRKIKYKLSMLGSSQFNIDESVISLGSKGKSQIRISYQCKQNKQQQAKLLLIPLKEDNYATLPQPLSFKLTTSILSKITLKKMQVNAKLYQVTNIALEVELPMDIIDFCEFSVSLIEEEQGGQSFFCFGQMNRILRNNHDKLEIKLIPLTLQSKFCRVSYKSSAFGEFNFEITAKIQPTSPIPQIKLKQLKVNKQEVVSIFLPKQNELLQAAIRFMSDHHIKTDLLTTKKTIPSNKYSVSIVQSSYISIHNEYSEISRAAIEGKDNIRIDLLCSFGKPFGEYSCTMMIKNDALKDVRYYKLSTSIAMKPKIIPMNIRTRAQEPITFKLPIKIAPCQCYIQNTCEQLSITNFSPHFKQNVDLIAIFTPDWIMQKDVSLVTENMETLEQIIYNITLRADEPTSFDNIKLEGSSIFIKRVKIPINLFLNQQLKIECLSKRIIVQDVKINPIQKKWIYAKILPCKQEETSTLKLKKQRNNHYFWASLIVSNKQISKKMSITLEEKPNNQLKYALSQLPLGLEYQIIFDQVSYLSYQTLKKGDISYVQLTFSPNKQMTVSHLFYVMIGQEQYAVEVVCKSPALPAIYFPEIISCNLQSKISMLHLINPSDYKGVYHAKVQPSDVFSIDSEELQFKGKQKRQIKIHFHPKSLQTRYKATLKFQSETLPTYQYNLTGTSQFQSEQRVIQCPIYCDREVLTDIEFTNHFSKHQEFLILQNFQGSPFELVQPRGKNLPLEAGASKKLIIKSNKIDINSMVEGVLQLKLGERKWKFRLTPIVIKNFSNRKHVWNCKARQTCLQNLELPPHFELKSLESSPQISPYLSFTIQEGTNNMKLKYSPLKPVPKQQFTVYLQGEKQKYALNCIISVGHPEFDDTILIKTKQINQVGCVLFKLTNIKKISVPFKAYFIKGEPDFTIEIQKNILQAYGRPGTPIKVKFASNVYNKRVDDELWIQTHQMLWRFKVKGIVSKKIQVK